MSEITDSQRLREITEVYDDRRDEAAFQLGALSRIETFQLDLNIPGGLSPQISSVRKNPELAAKTKFDKQVFARIKPAEGYYLLSVGPGTLKLETRPDHEEEPALEGVYDELTVTAGDGTEPDYERWHHKGPNQRYKMPAGDREKQAVSLLLDSLERVNTELAGSQ